MNNKDIHGKNIDYWKKHQELDKFNHQENFSFFISFTAISFSIFMSLCSIIFNIFSNSLLRLQLILFVGELFILLFLLGGTPLRNKLHECKQSFRIREAMLRYWYNEKEVNTDLLDYQFGEIKKKMFKGMSDKYLEHIAKEIMSSSNSS